MRLPPYVITFEISTVKNPRSKLLSVLTTQIREVAVGAAVSQGLGRACFTTARALSRGTSICVILPCTNTSLSAFHAAECALP